MIIGLTGPTGSGKSEISKYLKKKGFLVIDSDEIVRNLYVDCCECIDAVDRCFNGVVENNIVNKKKLSKIVFNNKDSLFRLCKCPSGGRCIGALLRRGYRAFECKNIFTR